VEFYQPPDAETAASCEAVSASYLCDCSYDVIAERVHQASRVATLNVGILLYCESHSDFSLDWRSNRIHARLQLGVDPFPYFARLAKIAGVPSLIYSWRIKAILRQTAPFLETLWTVAEKC
jgi:hypothetical protein